jgi:glutamine amidotransferase
MMKIAIIDYGLGNLRSIQRGLEEVGARIVVTHRRDDLIDADAIVLPGVGAFEEAYKNIEPLSETILEEISEGKAFLGICLGLQLLFTTSEEGGFHKGLDVFKGSVIKLPPILKVPHIGWNSLSIIQPENPLLTNISNGEYVYFIHSYYAKSENTKEIISKTWHGIDFPSSFSKKNIFSTQFHPEKSGKVGLQILKNFVDYLRS